VCGDLRDRPVSGDELLLELTEHREYRREDVGEARRQVDLGEALEEVLRGPWPQPDTLPTTERANHGDEPASRGHQRVAHAQLLADPALCHRHPMHRAVRPNSTRFGERRGIPTV
jgi:hypothetical protein